MISLRWTPGPLEAEVDRAVELLVERRAAARLWARDHTVFGPDPEECANRMGWLDAPAASEAAWGELVERATELTAGLDRVLVLGMGGSSLFPEVLASTLERPAGRPQLAVLDSTHPDAVRRALGATAPEATFHLTSSKSGSTVETRCHLAACWDRSGDPRRFGVVTDPGSALGDLARERGFALVVENDPDIGGRFSALSSFGTVPAALAGLDGAALVEAGLDQLDALDPAALGEDGEAVWLAAIVAAAAAGGREQLTLLLDPRVAAFGLWLEQLVAESLGKAGVGSVPVVGESVDHVLATPERRAVVTVGSVDGVERLRASGIPMAELSLEEPADLGAQVVLWEVAVALAAVPLAINPFDQPDVESAKVAARAVLAGGAGVGGPVAEVDLDAALELIRPGDHVAVCAFVDPGGPSAGALAAARLELGRRAGVATTFGVGPRFLHSTGQLHKGGPANQVVLQVVEPPTADAAVPGESFTFGELIAAQAAGDLAALAAAGQRAVRVRLDDLLALGEA